MAFWEDSLRYIYLPRLRARDVLAQAIVKGAATRDFFGTAYGENESKFDGFKLGDTNVQMDDTLLLIEPEAAAQYAAAQDAQPKPGVSQTPTPTPPDGQKGPSPGPLPTPPAGSTPSATPSATPKARAFHGHIGINASTAKMRLVQIADEIISILAEDPNAEVSVRLEIHADFPAGAKDHTQRTVFENAKTLGFNNAEWE